MATMQTPDRTALDDGPILMAVREMYTDVAEHPSKEFHFPTGRLACLYVGYQEEDLDAIPQRAVESFAGVGYPFMADAIERGDTVVDIGSGSGADVLIAARRTGPSGHVYGLDMTSAMIEKAVRNIDEAQMDHATIVEGRADALPFEDESADVVTSNGVINLVPDKEAAFSEAYRVLKPGGRLQIADIVLSKPASLESKRNPQLWAECIVGAIEADVYLELIRSAGFEDIRVLDQHDYFDRSPSDGTKKVARDFGAHTLVVTARKP